LCLEDQLLFSFLKDKILRCSVFFTFDLPDRAYNGRFPRSRMRIKTSRLALENESPRTDRDSGFILNDFHNYPSAWRNPSLDYPLTDPWWPDFHLFRNPVIPNMQSQTKRRKTSLCFFRMINAATKHVVATRLRGNISSMKTPKSVSSPLSQGRPLGRT
jgi:hypothetical protein